jgi:hypothetical protein
MTASTTAGGRGRGTCMLLRLLDIFDRKGPSELHSLVALSLNNTVEALQLAQSN